MTGDDERPEQSAQDAEPDTGPGMDQALPDATSLIATCISLLANKAWQAMGLVPNPSTKAIERRFDEAQLTIDAAAALADLLRPRVGDRERRDLETLVANLRINFVEQKSKAPWWGTSGSSTRSARWPSTRWNSASVAAWSHGWRPTPTA